MQALKDLGSETAVRSGIINAGRLAKSWENPDFQAQRVAAESIGITPLELAVLRLDQEEREKAG